MFATPREAGTGGDVDHESTRSSVMSALLLFKQGAALQDSVKVYLNKISQTFPPEDDVGSENFYLHAEIKAKHWRDPGIVDENVHLLLEKLFRRGPHRLPLSLVRHIVLLKYAGVLSVPLGETGEGVVIR